MWSFYLCAYFSRKGPYSLREKVKRQLINLNIFMHKGLGSLWIESSNLIEKDSTQTSPWGERMNSVIA